MVASDTTEDEAGTALGRAVRGGRWWRERERERERKRQREMEMDRSWSGSQRCVQGMAALERKPTAGGSVRKRRYGEIEIFEASGDGRTGDTGATAARGEKKVRPFVHVAHTHTHTSTHKAARVRTVSAKHHITKGKVPADLHMRAIESDKENFCEVSDGEVPSKVVDATAEILRAVARKARAVARKSKVVKPGVGGGKGRTRVALGEVGEVRGNGGGAVGGVVLGDDGDGEREREMGSRGGVGVGEVDLGGAELLLSLSAGRWG